jgi:hypothetical protein
MSTTLTNYDIAKHPAIDSANNTNFREVIGNKDDTASGNSLVSILRRVESRLNNQSKVYPTLADGIVVTGAAGAWTLGAAVEIIPANTITEKFLIFWVKVESVSLLDTYEIVLYSGASADVEIGRFRTSRDNIYPQAGDVSISTEILEANTKISAKVANKSGGSETVTISLHYVEITT